MLGELEGVLGYKERASEAGVVSCTGLVGSPCKRLSIKDTNTMLLPSWSLPTSSTGLCGETPFSLVNLYQPIPMARWVVQEREANMEECSVLASPAGGSTKQGQEPRLEAPSSRL